MRIRTISRIANIAIVVVILAVSVAVSIAHAQGPATDKPARPEVALGYTFLRSNAPPAGCTCFNLNGGNATFAYPLGKGEFAVVGDLAAAHAGNISSSGYSLTLSTYTAGIRYAPKFGTKSLQPFGQALVGLAHSSGSLVQGGATPAGNSGAAFASILGGGLDIQLNRRFSIRLFEADYVLTTIDNGGNNHQNNLRIDAGAVFHF
jgi:peptidoglycan-associated lipoprotein